VIKQESDAFVLPPIPAKDRIYIAAIQPPEAQGANFGGTPGS
jgi:hypothetical protein